MDERGASTRRRDPGGTSLGAPGAGSRRASGAGSLTTIGLGALGGATIATAALAGAGLHDDPLGTVTTSRLIPELVIAAVVVTVLVGLTLWLLLPAAPSTAPRTRRSTGALWPRVLGLVGWFALVVVLVVVVQRLASGTETPAPEPPPAATVAEETARSGASDRPPDAAPSPSPVVPVVITVGGVLGALVLLAWAVRTAVGVTRRPTTHELADTEQAPGDRPGTHRPALADALDRMHHRLASGDDPRLAVIEAYWSLEQAMTSAGVAPSPAETSSEFLARCLDTLGPGAEPARRLTTLFEWAMFSRREIDGDARLDAQEALREAVEALGRAQVVQDP